MSALLARIGGAAARHPWRTTAAWLLILAALFGLKAVYGGQPQDNYNIPGTSSQAATVFLRQHFPQMAGTDAHVVIHDRAGYRLSPDVLAAVRARLARMPGASLVSAPRLSAGGDTALIGVQYRVPVTAFHGSAAVEALTTAAAPARDRGLEVELGGMVPGNVSKPSGTPEALGILAALFVLALALGSLAAAGLPLVVAIAGLGAGTAVIGLLCSVTSISTTAPTVATMVGLGVGIDYALLLVSRHTEGLREGLTPQQAAARATSIAGTSVMIAGLTVLVSLFGLRLSTLPVYASFGYATCATVAAVMLATITLVPATAPFALHSCTQHPGRAAPIVPNVPHTPVRLRGVAMGVGAPRPTTASRWHLPLIRALAQSPG
jgi:putative drug exporter of the RND superfamily